MLKTLISNVNLHDCISRIALEITGEYLKQEYQNRGNLVIIGVLDSASRFITDLVQQLGISYELVFLTLQANSKTSAGILADIDRIDFKGKNVLIVDALITTGKTVSAIASVVNKRGAASVKTVGLICRLTSRQYTRAIDFAGFGIDDTEVVGYGLSKDGQYAELDYVAQIIPDVGFASELTKSSIQLHNEKK